MADNCLGENKKRILHFIGKLGSGGIETTVINIFEHIESYRFDVIVNRNIHEFYEDQLNELGGEKVVINNGKHKNVIIRVLSQMKCFSKLLKTGSWEIVHFHVSYPGQNFQYICLAKLLKKKIIIHIHSVNQTSTFFMKLKIKIGKCIYACFGDTKIACSDEAGNWCFGRDRFIRIYNGVDISKYRFDEQIRNKKRAELLINDSTIVLGTIGRMEYAKNHRFLVRLALELKQKGKDFLFVLVGDGSLRKELQEEIDRNGLNRHFLMVGTSREIQEYLCSFDIFVLPSRYEAFPVTLIEAQANGIPIISSSVITKEVIINKNFKQANLNDINAWVKCIDKINEEGKKRILCDDNLQLFDINALVDSVRTIYDKMYYEN